MPHSNAPFANSPLAIHGGKPVRTQPWTDNITTGETELAAVEKVLRSGYLSLFEGSHTPDAPFQFEGGPFVQAFENDMCRITGSDYAISVNSATSGLYAAIGALELGYGDEVIVSPYTMSACAVAPLIYGAIPQFADIDPMTGSLDPESIKRLITSRTKAILLVHQFGIPANMTAIMQIAQQHHIKVIEDCAQAWGATYQNRAVGTIADIGVYSLNVNKTIQTGEGGVCLTQDKELAYRLQLIRNHGEAVVDKAGYANITNILGYNYRLTELQAAIGSEQIEKLDHINDQRLELVDYFYQGLKEFNFIIPMQPEPQTRATYYITPFKYQAALNDDIDRHTFIQAVNAEGAQFYQGYVKPLYTQKLYQTKTAFKHGYPWTAPENQSIETHYAPGTCPVAEQLHFNEIVINEHIRLPHTRQDIDDLLTCIKKVVDNRQTLIQS